MCGFGQLHALKTSGMLSFSEASRKTSFIDVNKRMMHDFVISGSKFYSTNESLRVDWDWHDEVSINIFAFGLHQIRFGNVDNQVWFTELPFAVPNGFRRKIRDLSFNRALFNPAPNQLDSRSIQPPLVNKFSIPGFRQPRGHKMAGRNFCNLPGA